MTLQQFRDEFQKLETKITNDLDAKLKIQNDEYTDHHE
jgi:hypothetical protein